MICNVLNSVAPLKIISKSQVHEALGLWEFKEDGPCHLKECFFSQILIFLPENYHEMMVISEYLGCT